MFWPKVMCDNFWPSSVESKDQNKNLWIGYGL